MPNPRTARFRPAEIAAAFPDHASTLLLDRYLTDEPSASSRVFRVYAPTPPHYHQHSDEYLYVLSGTGTFWMDSPANSAPFAPGDLLYFQRTTVHAMPEIHSAPVVFLAIDTPRRDPKDIIFLNPAEATPESFIQPLP
jgi:mannose-6-phosphate isomerase-like protein (cupin superfamily)